MDINELNQKLGQPAPAYPPAAPAPQPNYTPPPPNYGPPPAPAYPTPQPPAYPQQPNYPVQQPAPQSYRQNKGGWGNKQKPGSPIEVRQNQKDGSFYLSAKVNITIKLNPEEVLRIQQTGQGIAGKAADGSWITGASVGEVFFNPPWTSNNNSR